MKKFIQILSFVGNYKLQVGLNIFFNLLMVVFSLFSFAAIVPFLELLFDTGQSQIMEVPGPFEFTSDYVMAWVNYQLTLFIAEHGKKDALLIFCGIILVMFLAKNLTRYLSLFNLAVIRNGVVRDIRQKVYQKVVKLPLSYFSEERKGNLISKMTNDIFEIEWSIIGSIEMLFRDPINFVIFLGTLFFMSWELTLFVLILIPVSGYLISLTGKSLKSAAKRGQSKLGEVLSIIEETLGGMRIIKGFTAEKSVSEKFITNNNQYFKLMVRLFRLQYIASPLSEFLAAIVMAVILWFGGSLVLEGNGMDGKFFIFYLIVFSQLIPPAKSFSEAFVKVQRGIAAKERIDEVLNADLKINELTNPKPVKEFKDSIELKNISFRYETENVLENINLSIKKGQTVALVGASGGGKSTMADMIPRFYDVNEGDILLDGVSLKDYKLDDLRSLMGIVSQESILFNDTVFNNICLSKPEASLEEVQQAAKIANADEFIKELEEGYYTNIGDGGNKLSGGQRQRLSIARAVLKNPPILILDEATSALDTQSEKLVQDALQKLMANRTSLVIAHRLSTIQHADLIAVVQEGKIVESGTHQELTALNGVYKKLCDLQSFA